MKADLSIIKNPKTVELIKQRCGENVIADGMQCPYCGAFETYQDGNDPKNTEKWAFMIRAFRVDHSSECMNCREWFG